MELGETLKLERWEMISEMFKGSDTPLEKVVGIFFSGAQDNLERIRAGREQSRRDWCVHASHSLKSSSANLGLERVSILSAHLEEHAGSMGLGELDQMILILGVELSDARRAIFARMAEIR